MNWSSLTKKQQQMVIATVILGVVQLFLMVHFLGWTKPAAARGGTAKKELIELEQKLDDARIILKREEAIRRELAESISKLESLTVHAPTLSDRYAWAYEYVSRCSTQSRIELDSLEEISFLVDDKKGAPADMPYEINVSTRCGYNSLVEFLWRLEKNNPLLRIKEVTISSIRDQNLTHQVRVVLQWPASVKIERGAQ